LSATVSPPSRQAIQYEEFYGFVQSPFTLAPDPRFLYLSQAHEAALQQVLQAIRSKEGIVVLTGDIGTGKTTLCRSFLERLDAKCFTSLLLNPFLSVEELLQETLLDFGVVSRNAVRSGRLSAASREDLVRTLREFLASLIPIGGSGVLIIDEAQHLSPAVLEELRVLADLETNSRKLLQIVLVGQLNLLDVLKSPDLARLNQAITTRAMLRPLTRDDVRAYIDHRLSVAHGSSSVTFDAAAVEAIYSTSQGVPRVINLLCDRSLTIAASCRLREIPADVVAEAAVALGLRSTRARLSAWKNNLRRWIGLSALIIAVVAAMLPAAPLSNPL